MIFTGIEFQTAYKMMIQNIITNRWVELVVFTLVLIPIICTDIRKKRIPDVVVLPAIALFVTKRAFNGGVSIQRTVILGVAGYVFFLLLYLVFKGKIGLGDAKLSALIAVVVGFAGWILALFIASCTGLLYGFSKVKFSRMRIDERIPYAPFLALGGIVSFLLRDMALFRW
jgi:prepilin signal peptidase PulO-like enzyme (type II secretory pathway)